MNSKLKRNLQKDLGHPGVESNWGFCGEQCLLDEEDRTSFVDELNEINDLTILSTSR